MAEDRTTGMETSGMVCQAVGTRRPASKSAPMDPRLKLNARLAMATGRAHHSRTLTSASEKLRTITVASFAIKGTTAGRATDKGTSKVTDTITGRAIGMTTSRMVRHMVDIARLARISGPA